jgi:hypothetical protein
MGGLAYEEEHSNLHPITAESLLQMQERERPPDEVIDLGEPKCLPTGALVIHTTALCPSQKWRGQYRR